MESRDVWPAGVVWAAVVAMGLAMVPSGVGAQQLDAGRLAIEEGNRTVGTERFRIWRRQGVVEAVALVTVEANGGGEHTMDVRIRTDEALHPVQYILRAEPQTLNVDGSWSGDRLRLHVTSAQGERWKEFATPGGAVVLETGVAHHYLLLVERIRDAGVGSRLDVIVPSLSSRGTIVVTGVQPDRARIANGTVAATRYDFELDGSTRRVWVDANGRLLRVEDPAAGRVATRLPDDG
jgi:hypothetical protein